MAFVNKAKDDHILGAVGQDDEAMKSDQDGFVVGGHYGTAAGTLDHGDFGVLQLNASGHLMVDIGSGEVIASLGTIGLVEDGTIAEVTEVSNLAAGTVSVVEDGTVSEVSSVTNLAAGTITVVEAGSVVVTNGTVGDLDTVGTVGIVEAGSIVVTAGTVVNTPVDSIASVKGTVTIASSDSYQAGTLSVPVNGLLRYVTQVTPDLEGTGTATTCLVDSSGGTVAALAAQNESVTTCYGTIVPMSTTMEWVSTADGTQSASRSIVLEMHYEQ